MEILYLLIPVSIILVIIIALVFLWSIQSGQYDDLDGPPYQLLLDDDKDVSADANDERRDCLNEKQAGVITEREGQRQSE